VKKLTPVLLVEEVEPCLGFWEALGFEKTIEVPEGDRIGFAAMARNGVEIMYQSRASVAADMPALADLEYTRDGLGLFIEVADLEDVKRRLASAVGAEETFPERTTFYGAREVGVRAPCGTHVVFAKFAAGEADGEPDESAG
jgi:uncharacterized glyoxalase superfamily protein PhnB